MKDLHIVIAPNIESFNAFAQAHKLADIHQLYQWGEFQATNPDRSTFWALLLKEDETIKGSALVIRHQLPFGKSWLYCPRGPLLDYSNSDHLRIFSEYIQKLAAQEQAIFFRFDSTLTQLPKLPFTTHRAHAHYQPEHSNIIDLTPPEEQILAQMKPKGRYNIKVAQKHGVQVTASANPTQDVEIFYNLLQQTTTRDHFSSHSLDYYRNMLTTLGPEYAKLYLAIYKNEPLAAAITTYCGPQATYYFGASSNEHRNTMAPYLLHWRIMQDAKKAGFHSYDLFGIAPENQKNHPWASVTTFKLKFGGQQSSYIPAQEVVYKPFWYLLLRGRKLVRRALRR